MLYFILLGRLVEESKNTKTTTNFWKDNFNFIKKSYFANIVSINANGTKFWPKLTSAVPCKIFVVMAPIVIATYQTLPNLAVPNIFSIPCLYLTRASLTLALLRFW